MADPELRSDEKVLVRTQGVYVKSIPFEGILTNKRIILIDRAKNLLPPKEIPLVTIKEVESGENAIRDQIITLSVMAKTGETRQMILTFSRQAGGNRKKERDEWARVIKENASSSFDQVIRKVIPGPEPAIRRAEPTAGPKYNGVPSPFQPSALPRESRPAGTEIEGISPIRRSGIAGPSTTAVSSSAVKQFDASSLGTDIFCSKCGNKVPAGSVFCNRCGSPIAQTPPVSAPVYTPPAPPVVKVPSVRPIDEEIRSIEPLIERSTEKIPPDALKARPVKTTYEHSFSWDDEGEESEQASAKRAADKTFIPRLFSEKSPADAAPVSAPVRTYEAPGGDTPPPPKPPRSRSIMPDKQTVLKAVVALVVILLVAAGAFFVYPILTSGGLAISSGQENVTPTSTSSVVPLKGTPVIKETPAAVIPPTGVYVHVNYMGGFKGSYGIPDMITTEPGNSGDRVWEVENATGTVQATFEKLDGSSHELLVEIYKNGKVLTSGTTTVGHGSVTLSVDTVTGKAAAPVTSGEGSTAKTAAAVAVTTPAAVKTTTPAAGTTTVTATSITTATAASTTTAAK
jgi:zinc-ribbon domain